MNPVLRQSQESCKLLQELIVKIHRMFSAREQDVQVILSMFKRRIHGNRASEFQLVN